MHLETGLQAKKLDRQYTMLYITGQYPVMFLGLELLLHFGVIFPIGF